MPRSSATTVKEYLDQLPEDRRRVIAAVRSVIRRNLPKGYKEAMSWGVISYEVPLKDYPDTYNGHALSYVALAARKNYYTIHLLGLYGDATGEEKLREQFKNAGKKLDMGKACVRFRSLDDIPLDVIGRVVAAVTPAQFIARYEASRKR